MPSRVFPCYDLISSEAADEARSAFQAALEQLADSGVIRDPVCGVSADDWETPRSVICEWAGGGEAVIGQVLDALAQPFYERNVLLAPYDYQ